ncbi:hypothetical protein CUTA107171_16165 [Cupriavidus taiwanensis]
MCKGPGRNRAAVRSSTCACRKGRNKKKRPEGRFLDCLVQRVDYFNASNTRAVISSTFPTPRILRYFGGATLAAGSPLAAQAE